jgi:hypothetical protein
MTKEELTIYAQELEEKLETASFSEGLEILKVLREVRKSLAAF